MLFKRVGCCSWKEIEDDFFGGYRVVIKGIVRCEGVVGFRVFVGFEIGGSIWREDGLVLLFCCCRV